MGDSEEKKKYAWRFPPCPGYDIEGTESWLESMAEQGLVLSEEGFFAGFARFERTKGRRIRYRLEAASKRGGLFSDQEDGPEGEQLSLSEASGWRFVTRWGDFFVFCTENPRAVELHTDPGVQAIAVNMIRRRAAGDVLCLLVWIAFYFFFLGSRMPLAAFLQLGTPLSLLGYALLIWSVFSSLASVLHLRRLWKRLRAGRPPDHRKNWKKRAHRYRVSLAAYLCLLLVWGGFLFSEWHVEMAGKNEIPLENGGEDIPFATLEDLASGGTFVRKDAEYGNIITRRADWLAPEMISLSENGILYLKDGRVISGGIRVDYYETLAPWMARELAREYEAHDRRFYKENFIEMEIPQELEGDRVAVYNAIFPTVILSEGNRMIRYCFYQNTDAAPISLEEWTDVVLDSVGRQNNGTV